MHGFTQTARSWQHVADDLAADHQVLTVELPGHGASSHVSADLVETAHLLAHAGGRATWFGYSLGGRCALHVALEHPEVVERLVLLGATAGIDDDDERTARRRADDELARHLEDVGVDAFLAEWLAMPMFAGVPHDADERAARATNTAAGLADSLRRAGVGTQDPLWDRLHEITVPTLVMSGERDTKFAALAHRLVDAIGASATIALIPGAGHAAHLEAPEATMAALRTWLRG